MKHLLALVLVSAGTAVPAHAQNLDNDHVELVFDPGTYALTSLVDRDEVFSLGFHGQVPLWRLRLLDTAAVSPEIDWSADFREVRATDLPVARARSFVVERIGSEQVLHLDWTDFPLPYGGRATVNVEVRLDDDSSESRWSITVLMTGASDALWRVDFPGFLMDPIDGDPDNDLAAVPISAGLLVRNPHANRVVGSGGGSQLDPEGQLNGGHPGGAWAMQWMQIYDESSRRGVLLRSTDTAGYAKGIELNTYMSRALMVWSHYPEDNHLARSDYSPSYEVRLRPMVGDWFDAARFYRSWLLAQPLAAAGPLETRDDFPRATAEAAIVSLITELGDFSSLPDALASHRGWSEFFGQGTLLSHLRGRTIGSSAQLPDPSPSADIVELLSGLGDSGIRSAPYTNTHEWPQSRGDDDRGTLEISVARTLNGERFYSALFSAWKMCPGAASWRDKYVDITNALVGAGSTDQYADLYTNVRLCFGADHGHPLGGGRWWMDGYRAQMRGARLAGQDARGGDFMISPEHRSEFGLDLFDFYSFSYWAYKNGSVFRGGRDVGVPIPIVAAVMHDYVGGVGGVRARYSELGSEHFRFAHAYSLVHGNLLALYHETAPNLRDVAEDELRDLGYLRALAHHRRAALKFLLYGEYLRPPDTGSGVQDIVMFGDPFEHPAVLGGAFRASDGALGVVMTNYNDTSRTADFRIARRDYALGDGTYEIYSFEPDEREFYGGFRGADYERRWLFDAGDILMLEVVDAADADGDGMSDRWETEHGLDSDDPADTAGDIDGDGLSTLEEYQYGTNPANADTDGDGVSDADEVAAGTDPRQPHDATPPDSPTPSSGCGCGTAGSPGHAAVAFLLLFMMLGVNRMRNAVNP